MRYVKYIYGNATWSSGDGLHVTYVNVSAENFIKPKKYAWVKALE
jgi:hypothetical protein